MQAADGPDRSEARTAVEVEEVEGEGVVCAAKALRYSSWRRSALEVKVLSATVE